MTIARTLIAPKNAKRPKRKENVAIRRFGRSVS